MVLSFFMTSIWSSLYLVQQFVTEVNEVNAWGIFILGFMILVMIYSLWATTLFMAAIVIRQFVPDGSCLRSSNALDSLNSFMVKKISSAIFGIDVNDTEGGEVVLDKRHKENALSARLDRLEILLAQNLAQNTPTDNNTEDLDNDFDDSVISLHQSP
jgi:hypothetical protein